ncbi:hypothetical protein [Pseudanabaena sp. PCC 6802]|uniref:hypothetical protein n=1 Tax=Pseudanabaena sp. PCC 6802 TaxID=118173 RepID=UPI00034CD516|nr:hypothetical protein [Pseudanabaena sp. PCC 6802]
MPRFQSWLFNSVDRSLPVELGRRARWACQRFIDRFKRDRPLLRPSEVWAQVTKQVAKVVLYPVYLIATAAKRSDLQLRPDSTKPPLLLRPFQQLVVWAESTDLYTARSASDRTDPEIDREIGIEGDRPQLGANPESSNPKLPPSQAEQAKIAPRTNIFPQIWQPPANLGHPKAFKLVSIAYEQQLERIRRLIKAAIDYFFGKKTTKPQLETAEVPSQPWLTMADLFDDGEPWPQIEQRHAERSHEQLPAHVKQSQQAFTGKRERSLSQRSSATTTPAIAAESRSSSITRRATGSITSSEASDTAITPSSDSPGEIVPDLSGWLEEVPDLEPEEPYRTLQAWIETQATFLGYVYSPIMEFIHRLDRLIARFEQWLVSLWRKLCQMLRRSS